MSTSRTALVALKADLDTVIASPVTIGLNSVAVELGVGWPPVNVLQNVARRQVVVGAINGLGSKNATRWMSFTALSTQNPTGVTTAVSNGIIAPLGSQTITVGGTIAARDAISAVVDFQFRRLDGQENDAAVASGLLATDTPSIVATKLATEINAKVPLNSYVSAVAVGPVVTITNLTGELLKLSSHVGNVADLDIEARRVSQMCQLTLWAGSVEQRDAISNLVETRLGQLQNGFGFQDTNGAWIRLENDGYQDMYDDTLKDVYRTDFRFTTEFGVTYADVAYSILAPVRDYDIE